MPFLFKLYKPLFDATHNTFLSSSIIEVISEFCVIELFPINKYRLNLLFFLSNTFNPPPCVPVHTLSSLSMYTVFTKFDPKLKLSLFLFLYIVNDLLIRL